MSKALLVLLCALAAATLTATTSIAVAQEPGVTVDPGSPSGKEYALPVDRARQQASKSKQKTGGATSPLFGEGVNDNQTGGTPAPAQGAPDTSASSASKAEQRKKSRAKEQAAKAAIAAAARAREAEAARQLQLARTRALRAQASTPDGGIGVGSIIALGVAVLLAGGLIGLWLRRRAATPA
jgi:hypothetical protein